MPFCDGRGPLWKFDRGLDRGGHDGRGLGLGYGRGLACKGEYGRRLGRGYGYYNDPIYEKGSLEEERRLLERRLKDLNTILESRKNEPSQP